MDLNKIVKTASFFSILGSAGLLVWWFLMPVLLPVADSAENFKNLILDDNWLFVNVIGLIAALLMTLGFPGFYIKNYKKFNRLGFIGLIVSLVGLIMFTCIQYYETFLWPAAAQVHPELVQVEGALVSGDIRVVAGLLVSGVFLGIGYILFGISALRTKSYPKTALWFLIIGAPVFGNGVAFPVRTVGLILLCIGTIWLSRRVIKDEK